MSAPQPLPDLPNFPNVLNIALEEHFDRTRRRFSDLGNEAPEAIFLGGGYGRSEGGVATDAQGQPAFFNDLDYFIFTKDPNNPVLNDAVHRWERDESEILGIDVEGKCLPRSDLEATPGSMMFYDLVAAHTQVMGPDDYLTEYKALARSETIEPIEATRLLWNRGSGLFFAKADLEQATNLSVVHRNQAKAKLALGDALLTIRGKYRPYVRERQQVLRSEASIDPRIVALHEAGTAFKLRPTVAPSIEELRATQLELTEIWRTCFLEVETKRLSHSFEEANAYIHYRGKLFTETSSLKNLALSVRDQIKRGGHLSPRKDYPRGSLQRSLLCLLSEPVDFDTAGRLLGAALPDLQTAAHHYTKWWTYYS
ncbi:MULTISPECIES: hypothetical protein [unclassified Lentimonas]|uniref:hypothetical protein n=1 Tax=unclassified Lentimonas TaxID=2630993 RepID=UPI001323CD6B|nr:MULTISPECIES: hypothetical protein [unclassified Lentimonas]CAA6678272.1 Unannotated [Lentimonas sp. CC4]CAA6684832.1 Unannotated [Lentimonas sp. CC6]CAA7076813.1 Unannotated [Lentimonas sp. CC4]CAA7170789.1 Unannotated [Lentimonas sp. CC21]CAA7179649.1 Unannotated [Lentimonas sp. CC8]